MSTIALLLVLGALILAIVALFRSRAQSLEAWGVLLLAAYLLLPALR